MAQIRFFKGVSSDLPATKTDGYIYVLESDRVVGDKNGELYVDVSNNKRLRIDSNPIIIYTETELRNLNNTSSSLGQVYLIVDDNNNTIQKGVKIGDGQAYIVDLPLYAFLTEEEKSDILNASDIRWENETLKIG